MTDEETIAYYGACLQRPTPWAQVDWGSRHHQEIRFRAIQECVPELRSGDGWLLDVGCGRADFLPWKSARMMYAGWDLTPGMIEAACTRWPGVSLHVRDVLASTEVAAFDYVVASGLFTHRDQDWMLRVVERMWALARRAVVFNCLSSWGPAPAAGEFHTDPVGTLAWCRQLTPQLRLDHAYLPHDFTVALIRP